LKDQIGATAAFAEAHRPDMRFVRIAGDPDHEIGNWLYDYSSRAIVQRWEDGERKAREALIALLSDPSSENTANNAT
jgi:hypothetical protein